MAGRKRRRRLSARRIAFEILLRVETRSSFAAELLNSPLTAGLEERDAALATELVLGTLRWQATLDFIAQRHAHRWASLDPEVRVALRLGLYQLRFLSRMPARAAQYETVELIKAAGKRSAAGLVNAVLRKSMEEQGGRGQESGARSQESESGKQNELTLTRPPEFPEIEWLAVEYSHPAWLLERWMARYGRQAALDLARANNVAPKMFLRLTPLGRTSGEVAEELSAQNVEIRPGNFLKDCRALVRGNITRTEVCRRGEVVLQDEASQMVPYLLDVQQGQRILDLCAAPGNKTAQLAQWTGPEGTVVACDVHAHRLARLAAIPACGGVQRVVLNGEHPLPFGTEFDGILVDAPCSGTGTLARHPEIKWRLTISDIEALSVKQFRLLQSAAAALRPAGRLVYSVCSLEREEGQAVAEKFLAAETQFQLLPLLEDAPRLRPFFHASAGEVLNRDFMETFPPRDGVDGFFAAIFIKAA